MTDAPSTTTTPVTGSETLVTGVSRSGRVRKKSSKLLDFQSPDEVEKKPKRAVRTPRYSSSSGGGGGRHGYFGARGHSVGYDDLDVSDDMEADDDDEMQEELEMESHARETAPAPVNREYASHPSEDELDELVAGLVESVEAESLEHANSFNDSKVRQSLYMTEKANKRKILKDGKVVTGKVERKDKGKSRYTAYSMWAREFRKSAKFSKNQDLDFSNAARRLGELWANVSNKEKTAWRRKAKVQATKARARETVIPAASFAALATADTNLKAPFCNRATTSRTRKLANERLSTLTQSAKVPTTVAVAARSTPPVSTRGKRNNSYDKRNSGSGVTVASSGTDAVSANSLHSNAGKQSQPIYTSTRLSRQNAVAACGTEPIDAAAHLKLLGDSLTIIGDRLKEHEGQITVSGSLSVLLDSLLCSLGPLMCLTKHIPGLERRSQLRENLAATLENIAYVMPGL